MSELARATIFISYARSDSEFVDRLCLSLQRRNYSTWIDRAELKGGLVWERAIQAALEKADAVLVVLSPEAAESESVAREYTYAQLIGKRVIPLLIGATKLPPIGLIRLQWISFQGDFEVALAELCGSLPQTHPGPDDSVAMEETRDTTATSASALHPPHDNRAPAYGSRPQTRETDVSAAAISNSDSLPERLRQSEDESRVAADCSDALIERPSLAVLLGTTAAYAGLELCHHLLSLSEHDRRRTALVFIDTDDTVPAVASFLREHPNALMVNSLRIAVPAGFALSDVPAHPMHTYLPARMPQYFAHGSGGIRNNGHVAAAFHQTQIAQCLNDALGVITRSDDESARHPASEVEVNLVAFLGGGTGSGILADVAIMVRQLLTRWQLRHRLNLFCLLPEPTTGIPLNELSWRQSNSVASLMELVALSTAAGSGKRARKAQSLEQAIYEFQLLNETYSLRGDPIANEVYLFGQTRLSAPTDAARLVGIDLFQRVTDASGVGYLERTQWVDRRNLAILDRVGLPTMFGSTCPVEVCFPAQETARAFAQISASYLLERLHPTQTMAAKYMADASQQLFAAGTASAAWSARLEYPHPHLRHLLDVDSLRDSIGRSTAVQRLFVAVALPHDPLDSANSVSTWYDKKIQERIFERHANACLTYLAERSADLTVPSLEVGGDAKTLDFAYQVQAFFELRYLSQLKALNMLDLLDIACHELKEHVRQILHDHLMYANGSLRALVAFEPELSPHMLEWLSKSLYLSMRWRTDEQKHLLDEVLRDVGDMTQGNLRPHVVNTCDAHRLLLSYGQHGISLTTLPTLYQEENSDMASYLRFQSAWLGLPNPDPAFPVGRSAYAYGSNKMPVHMSGELERLVCDAEALGANLTLPQRLIRTPQPHTTAQAAWVDS